MVISAQLKIGIDVVTDGEVARGDYVTHFMRHLNGIDFEEMKVKIMRNGNNIFKFSKFLI